MTKLTLFMRLMSSIGLPGTATTSAILPAATRAQILVLRSKVAALMVAACMVNIGGMPAPTMSSNSCAFWPCG
jgi:hypothetical protein